MGKDLMYFCKCKKKNGDKILSYGVILLGSRGNMLVFLILSNPKYNITTLSNPIPPPTIDKKML